MKIERGNLQIKKLFTPGVRLKMRDGFEYEVIDTFSGIIATCPQTGAIVEPDDYNKFAHHRTERGNDIVSAIMTYEFKEEANLIDELRGDVLLVALKQYGNELGVEKITLDELYRHAKLSRAWFDTKSGYLLCEEGCDFTKMTVDDFEFMKRIEFMLKK